MLISRKFLKGFHGQMRNAWIYTLSLVCFKDIVYNSVFQVLPGSLELGLSWHHVQSSNDVHNGGQS